MADPRLCSIQDCGKAVTIKSRGLCNMHYLRVMRHGDPSIVLRVPNGTVQRYYKEVVLIHHGNDCLIWPYARDESGYGVMSRNRKPAHVARFICQDVYGDPPNLSDEAAHSCGKGHLGCVSKSHLSWKTPKQNAYDRILHGTTTAGERCSYAKLTEDDVKQIILLKGKETQAQIASRFSVSDSLVSAIHRGKRWSHLSVYQRPGLILPSTASRNCLLSE
jgi:hypothetical protein